MNFLDSIWQFVVQHWDDFLVNVAAAFFGFLVAAGFRDRLYHRLRYGGWSVRLIKNGKVEVDRSISYRMSKEIQEEPADLSVFLKGVTSPYGRLECDILEKGEETGLLTIDRQAKTFTIDLDVDQNPDLENTIVSHEVRLPFEAEPEKTDLTVINFSHPLTEAQQAQIQQLSGQTIAEVRSEPTQAQIDDAEPIAPQARAIVDRIGLSKNDWQSGPILVIPPAYAPVTSAVLAELHGRMGHFPTIVRLALNPDEAVTTYDVVELVNLQQERSVVRAEER